MRSKGAFVPSYTKTKIIIVVNVLKKCLVTFLTTKLPKLWSGASPIGRASFDLPSDILLL